MEQHLSILISAFTLIGIIVAFRDKIFNKGGNEQKLKDRISDLEKNDSEINKCMENIKKDILGIKENHLTHIEKDINNINVHLAEINTTLKFLIKKK